MNKKTRCSEEVMNSAKKLKDLRNNYLENCDLKIANVYIRDHNTNLKNQDSKFSKRKFTDLSNSNSPVEGISNPLSSQPLLSKTKYGNKLTAPGSAMGW